ncbi:urease accessory protein UreD [Jidongwangia harbinensis]|uniref:urease accessory protein UreD n=1 Tax=Jidongwangia harbinensis TaxID=2878561 RepID=UPI001CD972D9|nr:urease accessory protein UreD [Jidongwangia harbinensis]MCA2214691.1 urease accessory protein UreD [Jidongwangia harbinensis]
MRASARIVAEADGRGGTRLAVLRGESPLLLRRTGPATAGGATVHLVGGAAGPLRGDDLRLEIEVGPGAELDVRSVAASLALPGRPGMPPSRLAVRAAVASGAALRWLPEPLIAASGCDHRTTTHVEVAAGGRLVWRDDLVCGRHGEPAGDVRTRTTIRYAGATLYRHDLAIGPDAPGWAGAAVLGGPPHEPAGAAQATDPPHKPSGAGWATGSVIVAGPDLPPARVLPGDAAVMPLAGPGMLAVAVGTDIRAVRAALDPLCDPVPVPTG